MRLFIIGYMASGKSTFGRALAEKTGQPFIDLDEYIEEQTLQSISQIFQEKGEETFRRLEREMLERVVQQHSDAVIACGGGTPCFLQNMDYLNDKGVTVFIETSTPRLISRLQEESENRPVMAGKTDDEIRDKVLQQLCDRLPDYMKAKLKWHGDDLEDEEQIRENVDTFVSSYPSLFR